MYLAHIVAQLAAIGSFQIASPPATLQHDPVVPAAVDDSAGIRPRVVDFGEGYDLRLKIHRYGSYAMLPLFATQYALGSRLLKQREEIRDGTRMEGVTHSLNRAHLYTALGIGTLFVSNTTTGLWNLYARRHDADHRGLRTAHALTMLLADAGFLVTGHMGVNAKTGTVGEAQRHHNVAIGSMAIATVGASMMWFFDH